CNGAFEDVQRMKENTYNEYADAYVSMLDREDTQRFSFSRDWLIPALLEMVGDVAGLHALDAGCGEGRIARLLSDRGAHVVGVDVSASLIEHARKRSVGYDIQFRAEDLSSEEAKLDTKVDLIVSHLVLDDVPDYRGFIRSLSRLSKGNSRFVVSKNNPYSAVIREKAQHYFDSGVAVKYRGLSSHGVSVFYYHRTLEEYISAFAEEGYLLRTFSDLKPPAPRNGEAGHPNHEEYERYTRFPFFCAMEFVR
ncbi:MAG: methyltransferase domain-containing protein, partial [Spirochaetia bacterium]